MNTKKDMENKILATSAGAMAGSSLIMSTSAGAMAGSAIIADSSGAMAGSALKTFEIQPEKEKRLRIVTTTVNDVCQLRCPGCYLGESIRREFMNEETQQALLRGGYNHLVIAGKEPFVSEAHIQKTSDLIRRLSDEGITVSAITNGQNLHMVPADVLRSLTYLDVSIDGGNKASYEATRLGGNWERLVRNVRDAKERTGVRIHGLHVLNAQNTRELDQMAGVTSLMPLDLLLFSPFTKTERRGVDYTTEPVDALTMIRTASESPTFKDNPKAFLYLGIYRLPEIDKESLRECVAEKGTRAILINENPFNLGVIRVTHDGKIMTPDESLHTGKYHSISRKVALDTHLAREYQKLVA